MNVKTIRHKSVKYELIINVNSISSIAYDNYSGSVGINFAGSQEQISMNYTTFSLLANFLRDDSLDYFEIIGV